MKSLKYLYERNDVLLTFSWIENDCVSNMSVWAPSSVADNILSSSGKELKTLINQGNILPGANIENATDVAVHRVGSIQEMFPNVEFINN